VGLGKDLRRSMRLREPAASHRPGMFVLANAIGLAERGPITAPISILLHSLLLKAQSGPTGTGAGRLPSGASEEAIPTPPGNAQAVVRNCTAHRSTDFIAASQNGATVTAAAVSGRR